MKKLMIVLSFLAFTLIIAGCSEDDSNNSSQEDDSNDSSQELIVYTPGSEELISALVPEFEEETGIEVELVTAATGELLSRIEGEASNPIADVMWGGSPSLIKPLKENFEDYVSENDEYLPDQFKNTEGFLNRYSSTSSVLLVNTDLIGDIEINGYADLLNPDLKGEIAHGDSTTSSSSYNHLENMLFAMGKDNDPMSEEAWDYVDKFLDNLDEKVLTSSGDVHKGVADGEYTVGLTYEEPAVEYMESGAPVEVVYMEEGTIFNESGSYIIKDANNLENAKKFTDFLLSEKGQNLIGTEIANRPLREDADLADYKVPLSDIKILDVDDQWGEKNKDEVTDMYMDLLTK